MRGIAILRELLWGWPTLLLILAAGLVLSVRSRFFQLRGISRWSRALFSREEGEGGIGSLQALLAALGGSLGTGNILGVGLAIAAGGPGALFWMWVSALLGMMTVYGENFLAAKYRRKDGPPGPLAYILAAGKRWGGPLAGLYAFGCAAASLGMGNMAQTKACAEALSQFGLSPWVTGLLLAPLLFLVGRGGLRFAVKITDRLVPLMSLLFLGLSAAVLLRCRGQIIPAISSIFHSAFSLRAGVGGGTVGMLLAMKTGVSRGVFTNEAGLGSSAFAYSAVEGRSPRELGCLGIVQVFFDTLVMCSVTGLCILVSPVGGTAGERLTLAAYQAVLGPWGAGLLSLCTALFALGTLVAWCCWGREGLFYLLGEEHRALYGVLAAGAAFLGCVLPAQAVFQLGDAANGLMALPNLAAIFVLFRQIST